MATQTLALPNVTSAGALSTGTKCTLSERSCSVYVDGKCRTVKDNGLHTESNTNGPKLVREIAKRGHAYVNLPTELLLPDKSRHRNTQPMSRATINHSTVGATQSNLPKTTTTNPLSNDSYTPATPIFTTSDDASYHPHPHRISPTSPTTGTLDFGHEKFTWSPRCPPDGASLYENSPPHSGTCCSSPGSKSTTSALKMAEFESETANPGELLTTCQEVDGDHAFVAELSHALSPVSSSPQLKAFLASSSYRPEHSNALTTGSADPKTHSSKQNEQLENTHITWSSQNPVVSVVTTQALSQKLPHVLPPAALAESTNKPYYHEHAKTSELRVPCSDANNITAGSGQCSRDTIALQSPPLVNPNRPPLVPQSPKSSTPMPLPPSTSPPTVPRRDPTTVLQQSTQSCPVSGITATSPITQISGFTPISPSQTTTNRSRNNTGKPSTLSITSHSSATTSSLKTTAEHSPTNNTLVHKSQQPGKDKSPTSPKSVIKTPTSPISILTTTKFAPQPMDYGRHCSVPTGSTDANPMMDGRSVVPWCQGTRELAIHQSNPSIVPQTTVSNELRHSTQMSTEPENCRKIRFQQPEDTTSSPQANWEQQVMDQAKAVRPTKLSTSGSADKLGKPNRRQSGERRTVSQRGGQNVHTESELIAMSPQRTPTRKVQTPVIGHGHPDGVLWSRDDCQQQRQEGSLSLGPNDYKPLSPGEVEWWRSQYRAKMISLGQVQVNGKSRTSVPTGAFQRQVSAGPTVNLSPTKHRPTSPIRLYDPDFMEASLMRSSTQDQEASVRQSMRQSHHGNMGGSYVPDPRTGRSHAIPFPETLVDVSHYRSDPKLGLDMQRRHPFHDYRRTHRVSHTDQMFDSTTQFDHGPMDYRTSSMTQSVFFPQDSAGIPPGQVGYEHDMNASSAASSASSNGRRRRSKARVIRSQSHRMVMNPSKYQIHSDAQPVDMGDRNCDPDSMDAYFQRSVSHTVPLQSEGLDSDWPPVLVQWHHRRRPPVQVVGGNSQQLPASWVGHRRVVRCANTNRSAQDLLHATGGNCLPHHHHSASAIFDRLELQPWYHFDLPRAGAERILGSTPVGSFLVRQSETSKSEYSISIRRENDVLHMKISRDPHSEQYVLGEYSQPYPSISAMIHRYSQTLLPVRGTAPIRLQYPVERSMHSQMMPKR